VCSSDLGDCCVDAAPDYDFSRETNSVPLMAVEFPHAAPEYPVVFAGAGEEVMPAVILGMRGNENLYLAHGKWSAKYIPAFVRRYPFVFSTLDEGKSFVLCVDEAFAGFNRQGRGQRLFGEDGKPTPYVDNVLKFLQEYQAQFNRTKEFCRKAKELDLLEPMQAQIDMVSGERLSLRGFWAVNRAKLKALSGEKLAELAKTDELELLYVHVQSMRNFNVLRERLVVVEGGKAEAAPVAEAAAKAKAPGGKPARRAAGD